MRLFLREHVPLILFSIVQLFVVLLVYWFDGYNDLRTALYSVFLGVFLLCAYLAFRYISHKSFYSRLSSPPVSLNDTIHSKELAPLSVALTKLLETQYSHYKQELTTWEHKQQEHIAFMNQWVHQMKTPLSVIELMTQDSVDPAFDSIAEETDRLRKGLEMALYISRLETFEQDFYVEKVALFESVDKVVHENKRFFIRNYVYPELNIDPQLTVNTDRKWLSFMLDQLLTNAIKYSAGSRGKVNISAYTEERAVILEMQDHGVGIPAADLPRVFRPFFTGENGRTFKESTGMGLYLVHEVATKLNHQVEIQSATSDTPSTKRGTTVRLIFPYAAP
ncbi:sensor histidine kinase [Paenibacillus sp. 481]|uniref:sensor histidine kinase n=1 Tax=Paenibacillus sp. 481 TaxID=2835869 RepID=UPI001E2FB1D1|nr:sensor histidine kinase [Paenibacillus sp. 481]UHA72630.1 sensor histidine kinase [Paenibacillus sp. 481]